MKIIQIRVVLRWSVCQLICNSAGDRILTSLPKILVLMFHSPRSKNHYYVLNMLLLCTTHRAHNFGNHFLLCECLKIEYLLTSCPCAAILIYKASLCIRPSFTLWPRKVLFSLFRPPPISNVWYLLCKNKFPKGETWSYLGLKTRIARTEKLVEDNCTDMDWR